jgi:hypothetical protein
LPLQQLAAGAEQPDRLWVASRPAGRVQPQGVRPIDQRRAGVKDGGLEAGQQFLDSVQAAAEHHVQVAGLGARRAERRPRRERVALDDGDPPEVPGERSRCQQAGDAAANDHRVIAPESPAALPAGSAWRSTLGSSLPAPWMWP